MHQLPVRLHNRNLRQPPVQARLLHAAERLHKAELPKVARLHQLHHDH
jgi:hypothetical protein